MGKKKRASSKVWCYFVTRSSSPPVAWLSTSSRSTKRPSPKSALTHTHIYKLRMRTTMAVRNKALVFLLLFVSVEEVLVGLALAIEQSPKVGTVIGIDLVTTYSCMGVYRNGHVEIIANDQGNIITPSWIAFTDTERLIGEAAKNQAALNPELTISDIKHLIGKKFDDPKVQRDMKFLPYKIVNKDGKPYVEVKIKDGEVKLFSPEEISAMVLGKMKETAEAYLGKKIKDAVITVPGF